MTKKDMRYVEMGTLPGLIPRGEVLVHNRVVPRSTRMRTSGDIRARVGRERIENHAIGLEVPDLDGSDGSADSLELCDCGWSGLKHYRAKRD